MATDRARPAQDAGEREMLTGWLEHHRGILIWKCDDLTAGQLRRRAVPPSTLSLLGLVRHMAEVERGWFRQVFLGEDVPDLYDRSADEDADLNDVDQADPRRHSLPSNGNAPRRGGCGRRSLPNCRLDLVGNRYEDVGAAGSAAAPFLRVAGWRTVRPSGTGAPGVKQGGQAGLVRWAGSPC